MKCFHDPVSPVDPYPDHPVDVETVAFTSDLVLFRPREHFDRSDRGQDVYTVGSPLQIRWTGKDCEGSVSVPPSFITDLTSVPPGLRWLVSRAGPWLEAAVVHDFLYVAWQTLETTPTEAEKTRYRKFSDDIMFAGMTRAGVRGWRKWGIYLSVRLFGGWTFRDTGKRSFVDATDPRIQHLAALVETAPPNLV